uniref:AP_endonuc_2 domain-containing protein n=1 Tax=Strongyloides papillosus TaxID=174720 RepID=A0A0N5CAN3_STREA
MHDNEKVSVNDMKTILSNQPKINFENNNFISFLLEDGTEKLSDDDKIYLANKYSSLFQFIIINFPNVNELRIINGFDNISNSSGSIFYDILKYAEKYNFSNHGIFDGLTNLNEICLYIRSNIKYDNLSNINDSIKDFLDYIVKIKDVRLIIDFECGDNDSLANALKMLNYGKTINLNILMDHDYDWDKYLKENNYNLSDGRINIKNETKSLMVSINEINDFIKTLKIL